MSKPLSQSLFGRRKVRHLRPYRQRLMDELLPTFRINSVEAIQEFSRYKSYVLEIGFGSGEHLSSLAQKSCEVGVIGAEVFVNGIASLLADIDEKKLTNIRIFDDDARLLIPKIPNDFLDSIYLLFPDPWHKKRHAKRRLLQKTYLAEFSRILKPHGTFHIASDNPIYIRHALHVMAHSQFQWLAKNPSDWQVSPLHVQTRFEAKAIKQNRPPHYLNYRLSI